MVRIKGGLPVQECENYSEKFITGGDHSFFMFHSLFFFISEEATDGVFINNSTPAHIPECSSYVWISSFRDFEFSFVFSGFFYDRVYSCVGGEFFMRRKSFNILNFSHKVYSRNNPYALYRCNDFYFFFPYVNCFCDEFSGKDFNFFFEIEESSNKAFEDDFFLFIFNTYGIVSNMHDAFGFYRGMISFSSGYFINDFFNFSFTEYSCYSCRWDIEEKEKGCFREYVIFFTEFKEDVKYDLSYSVFNFSDFLSEFFSFSCEVFKGLGRGILREFVFIKDKEFSDCECINFIGFTFSESYGLVEFFNNQRVYEKYIKASIHEEGENVDMVVSCGFYSDDYLILISEFGEYLKKGFEGEVGILKSISSFYFFIFVYDTYIKFKGGYIYAYEIFKHGIPPFLFVIICGGRGGLMPSFPSSELIRVLRPNQLMREKEGGGETPLRALCPFDMSSPVSFSPLFFLSKNNITNFNINST